MTLAQMEQRMIEQVLMQMEQEEESQHAANEANSSQNKSTSAPASQWTSTMLTQEYIIAHNKSMLTDKQSKTKKERKKKMVEKHALRFLPSDEWREDRADV